MVGYEDFIADVRERAGISSDEAERTACATLRTLAECTAEGELRDVARRLPEPLRTCAAAGGPPQRFHAHEFLHRVAERARIADGAAARGAEAVFTALYQAVGPDELAGVRAQLPKDLDPLLDAAVAQAPAGEPAIAYDEFVRRVAERLPDAARAERAVDDVLEALAERISGAQVTELERVLPPELRPPLERGRALTGGHALPMPLGRFLAEIERRECAGSARRHARAVLTVLGEAIPEKERGDTLDQLRREYRALLRD